MMRRSKTILFIIFICLFINSSAQGKATISGKVFDSETSGPLPFASVTLTAEGESVPVSGTATDEGGNFIFTEVPEGYYTAEVSFLSFKPFSKGILVGTLNENYDLGRIFLEPETESLAGAAVSDKRETTGSALDKKSFSLSDKIAQSGGSVLEAMKGLPGVTVTQEGKVLLRGSDQVAVLLDGKQSSLTGFGSQKGLDNIPAANIDRIEIINNPSAKYQANGMAGIINIIYRKETRTGFNGDLGFNFGLGELTTRKENLPGIMDKSSFTPKYNPALNINYRTTKVNFFLQSSAMFRKKQNSNQFNTKTFSDGSEGIASQFLENRTQQEMDIKAGLDWYISEEDQLTFYGLFNDEWHIDRGAVPYDYIESGKRKRLWGWAEDENTWDMNYGIDFSHQFSQSGHKISANLLYKHGVEDELFPFTDESATRSSADSTHLISKEKILAAKIDYVKPLSSGRVECGADLRLRHIPMTYDVLPGKNSILDANLGDWSDYKEDVAGIYANYFFESRLIEFEGGLRAEYSSIHYKIDPSNIHYTENESYHELPLFPNARLSFKLGGNGKLSLFINRRVDRPDEFDLRPFPKYDDPELLRTGNPYLRPQYTWNAELAYKRKWKGGSVFASAYYKKINDIISRVYVQSEDDADIVNSITQNLGSAFNAGMEVMLEQQMLPGWSANASFNWYRNVIDSFKGTVLYPQAMDYSFEGRSGNTWNAKVSTSVQLQKTIDAQLSFVFYAPDVVPQGKSKERSSLDLGIRKKLLDDRMELSLNASDLLNRFAPREILYGKNFTLEKSDYYETQVITLGLKYKF